MDKELLINQAIPDALKQINSKSMLLKQMLNGYSNAKNKSVADDYIKLAIKSSNEMMTYIQLIRDTLTTL